MRCDFAPYMKTDFETKFDFSTEAPFEFSHVSKSKRIIRYLSFRVCVYVCVCVCNVGMHVMYVFVCVCMYVCVYVCVCMCVYNVCMH